jgi:RNA polymerase sigma-70 factor (ECF subfamily)
VLNNNLNNEYEETIWNLYLNGDNESIEQIHKLYGAKLLILAYKYTRNKTHAEDIVYDLFERLLSISIMERNRLLSAVRLNPVGLLSVIVKNKCLDEIKMITNREKILKFIRLSIHSEEQNNAYNKFAQDFLEEMFSYLEPKEAQILRMNLSGFSNQEISKQLGISYHTTKNNLYEGRKKLKKLWEVMTR